MGRSTHMRRCRADGVCAVEARWADSQTEYRKPGLKKWRSIAEKFMRAGTRVSGQGKARGRMTRPLLDARLQLMIAIWWRTPEEAAATGGDRATPRRL